MSKDLRLTAHPDRGSSIAPLALLLSGVGLLGCTHESSPVRAPDPPAAATARSASVDGGHQGKLGKVEARGACTCDTRRRLWLELKATCQTKGGIQVQISGQGELAISEDLPADAWRSVTADPALDLPRTVRRLDLTLHSQCRDREEPVLGAYSCVLDESSGCS